MQKVVSEVVNRRPKSYSKKQQQADIEKGMQQPQQQQLSPREEASSLEVRRGGPVLKASECIQDRYSYAGFEADYNVRCTPMVEQPPRILPQRPFVEAATQQPPRRKLPEIPKSAKLSVRHVVPPEPHYPSSFHSSFDEGGLEAVMLHHNSNPQLASSQPPHPIYESYHQQFRQLKRQHSSPMGSRQLPMAPFGHRRTASSASFGPVPNIASPGYLNSFFLNG